MGALRLAAMVGSAYLCACAAGGGHPPAAEIAAADTAASLWGDEHAGLVEVVDETDPPARHGATLDVYGGETRALRVTAASGGVAARARTTPAWTTGGLEWRGRGWLRQVAAGCIQPSMAEGALVGDPRDAGELRADASAAARGLRVPASLSRWGTVRGGGAVVAAGPVRLSAGVWRSGRDADRRAGAAAVEHRFARGTAGAGVAASDGASGARAWTFFASHEAGPAAVGAELALADEGPRVVARAALGERREWRAVVTAGTRRAADAAAITHARERRGVALERHDARARATSRLVGAVWTERDGDSELSRRRIAWNAAWRVAPGARMELAARFTRDLTLRFEDGPVAAPPGRVRRDEWRLRAALHARRELPSRWSVDNAYRIDLVRAGAGPPGTLVSWTGSLARGAIACTLSATSHALHDGAPAYASNPGLVGEGAFTPVSGRGTGLSASLRASLGRHARAGGTWAVRGPAPARVSVFLSLDV